MPHLIKPKFEQYRSEAMRGGAMMRERDIVPRQAALVDALGEYSGLLLEKVRRLPNPEGMIEISAKWLGLDGDPDNVVRILKKGFPIDSLGLPDANFTVGPSDEAVLVLFAGKTEDRFLTGRLLILF